MDNNEISYAQAMKEIESIADQLGGESVDIDTLTAKLKRANELIALCKQRLVKVEKEVTAILSETDQQ